MVQSEMRPTTQAGEATAVCPACQRQTANQWVDVFRETKLYACLNCGLQFWHRVQMPDLAWHELVYGGRDQRILPLEPGHRFFLSDALAPGHGRLLDVGCGTGNFLSAARTVGYDVAGLELNQNAARFARERTGIDRVLPLCLDEFVRCQPMERFDVVTFFEVLEHQDNPRVFLKLAKGCLRDGGYIALSVPNRERWQRGIEVLDYPPNHLTRWNAKALSNFLIDEGFDVLSIREEPLGVRRAAQVLSAGLTTGMAAAVASAPTLTPSDLAEMEPEAMRAAAHRSSDSLRSQIASRLVQAKNAVLLPVALALLPYLRLRGCKGLYLYCLAKRRY
jgi:2-polyprenyl-3-methyl-5-hydroxy-6-metoxy-1,4-benzoquinol methylase